MISMLRFIFFTVCFCPLIHAELMECGHLRDLLPLVEEGTLVVFNINNVLTISSQHAGSTPWAEEQIAQRMATLHVDKPRAVNLFIPLWHDILIASDVELFDPDAEAVLHLLQKRGISVMALTNRYIEMA